MKKANKEKAPAAAKETKDPAAPKQPKKPGELTEDEIELHRKSVREGEKRNC